MDSAVPTGTAGALVREMYFPTSIFFRDLPHGRAMNAVLRAAIYAWREADPTGIVRSNVRTSGSWHSALDMQKHAPYAELVAEIVAASAEIFETLGYDPAFAPELSNMWANINPRGAYNRGHVHPNVLWSGVYYVQASPGSGRILFADPRPQATMVTPVYRADRERQPELWSEVYFEPIEGRLILFPAWLLHEVEVNATAATGAEADRISVSFNIVQRRKA